MFSESNVLAELPDSSAQVIWRDGGNRVDICASGVRVFKELTNVCYVVSLKRGHEWLRINYLARDDRRQYFRWIEIKDDNHDGQADRVLAFNFQYKRSWPRTAEIFRKADELLGRFRKELEVQKVLEGGPVYPDPFLPSR